MDSHYFCRVVIKISNIITTAITIVTTTDTTIIVDSDLVCFSNYLKLSKLLLVFIINNAMFLGFKIYLFSFTCKNLALLNAV